MGKQLLRVGAAQVAPVFFDRAGTLKKTCEWIAKAGERQLDLVVFPETYVAAYPYWRGAVTVRRSTELIVRMQDCAIRIPGEETETLCQEARRGNVNCVIGCNELDDRPGSLPEVDLGDDPLALAAFWQENNGFVHAGSHYNRGGRLPLEGQHHLREKLPPLCGGQSWEMVGENRATGKAWPLGFVEPSQVPVVSFLFAR